MESGSRRAAVLTWLGGVRARLGIGTDELGHHDGHDPGRLHDQLPPEVRRSFPRPSGHRVRRWVRARVTGPRVELIQQVKAAAAAALAWALSQQLLGSTTPVFAALSAFFVVESTVARSVTQWRMSVLGVSTGLLVGAGWLEVLHPGPVAVGLVMLTSLLVARLLGLDASGSGQAASASLVAVTVASGFGHVAALRVVSVGLGAGVGLGINAVVAAPVHVRPAGDALAELAGRLATLLRSIAGVVTEPVRVRTVEEWLFQSRELTVATAAARVQVDKARESVAYTTVGMPPGRAALRERARRQQVAAEAIEHAVIQVRGMCRSLADASAVVAPDEHGDRMVPALLPVPFARAMRMVADGLDSYGRAAQAVQQGDAEAFEAAVDQLVAALKAARGFADGAGELARAAAVDSEDASTTHTARWLLLGAVVADLVRLLDELDPVGGAHPDAFPLPAE